MPEPTGHERFRWLDGERTIVFGRGTLDREGPALAGADGSYAVLTTARAEAAAAALLAGARAVHHIPPGRVDEIAGELLGTVDGELLVAIGGGRVIDTAKALAAASPADGRRVMAVPTTLSGAEMTAVHRQAVGAPSGLRGVRPAIVLNDPALSASQPVADLAASAGNALGHAAEGPVTPLASPVPRAAALQAARLIAAAFAAGRSEPDRDALALGALLAGYVIDATRYGLHHVLSQTLVRFAGVGHGQANTLMLPVTLGALAERAPGWIEADLAAALGEPPAVFARRLVAIAGLDGGLRGQGIEAGQLGECAAQAAARPELHLTPPVASEAEIRELYDAAAAPAAS